MTHLHRKQNETKNVRQASRRQGRAECPSQLCQYCLWSADTPEENILPVPEPTAEDNRVDQTFREQRSDSWKTHKRHREESTEELGIRWNVCCVIPRRHVAVYLIFTGTRVQHTRVRGSKDSNTKTQQRISHDVADRSILKACGAEVAGAVMRIAWRIDTFFKNVEIWICRRTWIS